MNCSPEQWLLARLLVPVLVVGSVLITTTPCWAGGGYQVALTPVNDPDTGNFKVRIAGYRDLMAHVVTLPGLTDAPGVTVQFFTSLGTVNHSSATTDANGKVGVTLWGGWEPNTATVRARVVANGTNYDDVALVPVVAPDGEDTSINSQNQAITLFQGVLTPSDVNFSGMQITERDGGNHFDVCVDQDKLLNGKSISSYVFLTGGTWTVAAGNSWSFDSVGDNTGRIERFRKGPLAGWTPIPLPCDCGLTQHMDVVRPGYAAGNLYYTSNSSQMINTVGSPWVANTRDAVTDTFNYGIPR